MFDLWFSLRPFQSRSSFHSRFQRSSGDLVTNLVGFWLWVKSRVAYTTKIGVFFIQISMDCRKFATRKPHMLWEHRWFPVFFPLNQSIYPSHGHMLWACRALISSDRHSSSSRCVCAANDHGKTGEKTKKKLRLISTNSSRFQSLLITSNYFYSFLIIFNHSQHGWNPENVEKKSSWDDTDDTNTHRDTAIGFLQHLQSRLLEVALLLQSSWRWARQSVSSGRLRSTARNEICNSNICNTSFFWQIDLIIKPKRWYQTSSEILPKWTNSSV